MNRKLMKKVLFMAAAVTALTVTNLAAWADTETSEGVNAAETGHTGVLEKIEAVENTASKGALQSLSDIPALNLDSEIQIVSESEGIRVNANARSNYQVGEPLAFHSSAELTTDDLQDLYIFETTKDYYTGMGITSADNSSMTATVYLYSISDDTYYASNFKAVANAENQFITLPAGKYLIGVQSSSAGSYTLNFNATTSMTPEPLGSVYISPDLSYMTFLYSSTDVRCNGEPYFTSDFGWEDHYTLSVDEKFWGRDMMVHNVKIRNLGLGGYRSSRTKIGEIQNALFVNVGIGTTWTLWRSYHDPKNHEYDHTDATGQETPRALDEADMLYNHYIVIDLAQNQIVDFASPLNYYYCTGETYEIISR